MKKAEQLSKAKGAPEALVLDSSAELADGIDQPVSIEESATDAINQTIAEGVIVLKEVESQLEQASGSLGVTSEQAEEIFVQEGFEAQLQDLGKRLNELVQRTKGKIVSLIESSSNKTQAVDTSDPRAEAATRRIAQTLERVRSHEKVIEGDLWPKIALLADADHIENQQIELLYAPNGDTHVVFKLTGEHRNRLKKKFPEKDKEFPDQKSWVKRRLSSLVKALPQPNLSGFKRGKMTYKGQSNYGGENEFEFECYERQIQGGVIRIADSHLRSTHGLVKIEISAERAVQLTPEALHREIAQILNDELGVRNGTLEPAENDARAYKLARYRWLHKTDEVPDEVEKRLVRKEVSPGYHTFVDEGKHQEYLNEGNFGLYHKVYEKEALAKILKAGGLLSTHERYRRGLLANGMSSSDDMKTGGADSVFTRLLTAEGVERSGEEGASAGTYCLVFEPRILDRTDWYAYSSDHFGSTEPERFANRKSPDEIMSTLRKDHLGSNEQMFRSGISTADIRTIAVNGTESAISVYRELLTAGITEVSGRPIEEMIVVGNKLRDIVAISSGQPLKDQVDMRERFLEVRKEIEQALEEQVPLAA